MSTSISIFTTYKYTTIIGRCEPIADITMQLIYAYKTLLNVSITKTCGLFNKIRKNSRQQCSSKRLLRPKSSGKFCENKSIYMRDIRYHFSSSNFRPMLSQLRELRSFFRATVSVNLSTVESGRFAAEEDGKSNRTF